MVCRAGSKYFGADKTSASWENWSGDVTFSPERLRVPKHAPPSGGAGTEAPAPPPYISDPSDGLASLVEAVADATDKKQELHVIGNGWAFEDCAKSDKVMVSLANLNLELHDVLDPSNGALTDDTLAMQNDPFRKKRLVHFEAGIRIADLCEALDKQNLAMPTLGGSNGQSLAGAISTSTHGGDWNQPPFPDVVRAVHLVTEGGGSCGSSPLATRSRRATRTTRPCARCSLAKTSRS
jgi:FAD/FMN-containing dehydrogenase